MKKKSKTLKHAIKHYSFNHTKAKELCLRAVAMRYKAFRITYFLMNLMGWNVSHISPTLGACVMSGSSLSQYMSRGQACRQDNGKWHWTRFSIPCQVTLKFGKK